MDPTVLATLGITILTGTATIFGSWFVARSKARNDSFSSIIKANEDFRSEVRKDLVDSKKELDAAGKIMEVLRFEVEKLRIELNHAREEIASLRTELKDATYERDELIEKIQYFEGEIKRLQGILRIYEADTLVSQEEITRLRKLVGTLEAELLRLNGKL